VCFLGGKRCSDAARVLLISSSGGKGWVFPKGGWELDETAKDAARRETVEEGGVRGELEEPQLGEYPYCNRKMNPQRKGCIAHVFVMHVQEELKVWPEAGHRIRRWVCILRLSRMLNLDALPTAQTAHYRILHCAVDYALLRKCML
jgi:diphosphoinositol-polyphosphate diphosphatase